MIGQTLSQSIGDNAPTQTEGLNNQMNDMENGKVSTGQYVLLYCESISQ